MSANKMEGIVLKGVKEPLITEEVDIPVLSSGEVLVKVHAAGFNHRDWWIQQGQYAGLRFPIILGSDGSGIVSSVFSEGDQHLLNKEVIIYPGINWGKDERFPSADYKTLGLPDNGCWAEYVKVPAESIFPKVAHLSFEENAALPVAGLTAWRALMERAKCQLGDKVLISGAGGGAATFAIQYAVAVGAEVYVTSGSDSKIQKAIELGAVGGVNYHDADWVDQLKQKVSGFDVIIDSALGKGFASLVDLAAKGGSIAFFGETAGAIPELNGRTIFSKQLNIYGTSAGSPADFQRMLDFIKLHQLHPVLDTIYTFDQAEQAMRSMDKGNDRYGKAVMKIL